MNERIITLETIKPVEIYGINNEKIQLVKSFYPSLKIIARGNEIKIMGNDPMIQEFENRFLNLLRYYQEYSTLNMPAIERIMQSSIYPFKEHEEDKSIILYGRNGKIIKAKSPNQQKLVDAIEKNDLLFSLGPAGTGKTYTAVALAVKALKNNEVKRIVLTRPAVEAGERLGFLPGDYKEKLDPYLRPLYDALNDMLPGKRLATYIEEGIIEIAPLAFMRGRTLDHAFVILDEAQNTTPVQLKMFLTRMGSSAKFIVNGDKSQIDLPRHQESGLADAEKRLKNIPGIEIINFDEKDIVRHPLVAQIIKAYY